jgi:hypothetical protein
MPPRLAALESSGADSTGLTEAVLGILSRRWFGSRNGMSLCGRSGRHGQFVSGRRYRHARSFASRWHSERRLSRSTYLSLIKTLSLATCYPESRRRALVSRSGEGAAPLVRKEIETQDLGFLRLILGRASGSSFQPGSSSHSRLKSAQSRFSARMSFNFFSRRQPLISTSRILARITFPKGSHQTSV